MPMNQPPDAYVVSWDDAGISCTSPSGKRQSVQWADLRSVRILTTDGGPFVPDLFWLLEGAHSRCVIPQGAQGEAALLERLQQFPGFDSSAVIAAAASTDNAEFTCWRCT